VRSHLTRTSALACAVALSLGLAACSGSGSESDPDASATAGGPAAFCALTAELDEAGAARTDVDPNNPKEFAATLEDLTARIETVDAPAEVADAVDTVSAGLRSYTDGLSEVLADPKSEDAMTRFTEAMEAITNQEYSDALTEITEYTRANC
jgi:hypothetical protein